MNLSSLFITGIPKVAVFLLFFAFIALLFEIFYFRKKRDTKAVPASSNADPALLSESTPKPSALFKGKYLVIIGMLFILFVLPLTLYLVSQRVTTKQEAVQQTTAVPTLPQTQTVCSQVDIQRGGSIVDSSQLVTDDVVTLVGYCYIQSSGGTTQDTIYTLHFEVAKPSGTTLSFTQLAFDTPEKNSADKHFFRASYPLVKLSESGTYTVRVRAFSTTGELTKAPFIKTFTVGLSGKGGLPSSTGNNPPVCSSLSPIPFTGPTPLTVSFTGSGSDSDGQIASYEFTFGDGTKQTVNKTTGDKSATVIAHVYQSSGTYTASLRLTDNNGSINSSSALCQTQITVSGGTQTATISSNLKAQPSRPPVPSPTSVQLPKAGMELPVIGFTSVGLLLLTAGLLLAF